MTPNTTYYVRAYATNTAGTAYGGEVSFTTAPSAPTVNTTAASGITTNGATLNGAVNANNSSTTVTFEYGTTTSYGTSVTAEQSPVSGTNSTTVSKTLTGLTPNTTYHYRVIGVNAGGTVNGADQSLTTLEVAPTVTTQAASDITAITATGHGNIIDLGVPNPTQHGVCWSSSANPTTADSKTEEGAAGASGAFTSSITGLTPNTTYYVRAYATNTAGTAYGGEVSFTTAPSAPTVNTTAASGITTNGATLNGAVNANNSSTTVTFEYGTTTSYGTSVTAEQSPVSGTNSTTVSKTLTGLTPNTTYHYRVIGVNAGGTVNGADQSLTTLEVAPTVTTQAASDITAITATGHGNIIDLGVPNPTQHGVCWSSSANPTTADSKTEEGAAGASGAFTSSITGLTPNTTYYVRAYATNTAGTAYGGEVSFTTAPSAPTVNTTAASGITTNGATLNGAVNANNSSTTVTFEYGTTTSYGTSVTAEQSPVSGTNSTTVSKTLTGLTPNTTYHYRVIGVNAGGTANGADQSVTTLNSTGSGSGGGGSTTGSSSSPAGTSTSGSAPLNPSAGGNVGLGNEAMVQIPANALKGNATVEVVVSRVTTPQPTPSGFMVLGNVYEFKVEGNENYQFNSAVTLTFTFDPDKVPPGQIPQVYYYDQEQGQWVNLGGTISGNTISVTVNHFTKFSIMAKKATIPAPSQDKEDEEQVILSDIAGHWAESSIKRLVADGVIGGYSDGTFQPERSITQAEFATILVKAFKLQATGGKELRDTSNHWAKNYISIVAAGGIINGYNPDTFRPDIQITREQMAVMIYRAAKLELDKDANGREFTDCKKISDWAKRAVANVSAKNIMIGYPDNSFRPGARASRAEAVTIIVNTMK